MIAVEKFSNWSRSCLSEGWIGFTAFSIDCRSKSPQEAGFIWGHTNLFGRDYTDVKGGAFDFLLFEKA